MLIDSPRITERDRYLWGVWLQADKVHSRSDRFVRNTERTKRIIYDFLSRDKPYFTSLSWGKDSVVLAHMMHSAGSLRKYVYIRNLAREPEGSIAVRDSFLVRFPIDYEEIVYDYSDADETYYDKNGNPKKWQYILADLQCRYGCHVTGIRYDESAKRRLRFKRFGLETGNSFAPFRIMDAQDIFAYLFKYDLPVHPNYAMTGGGRWDKYRIRVAAVGNREGDGIGRAEWEREYYADILNRIERLCFENYAGQT